MTAILSPLYNFEESLMRMAIIVLAPILLGVIAGLILGKKEKNKLAIIGGLIGLLLALVALAVG